MQDDSQKGGVGIWILVVVIIAVGAFWFYRSRTVETVPESGVATIVGEAIVIYDANGFSPNTVTIKKGKTVIFHNKTGKPASVASGPHPTHTKYVEFDQTSGIPEGTLMLVLAVFHLAIALWILSGWRIFIPSLIATVFLFSVVYFNWNQIDILFRDISLALASLALAWDARRA